MSSSVTKSNLLWWEHVCDTSVKLIKMLYDFSFCLEFVFHVSSVQLQVGAAVNKCCKKSIQKGFQNKMSSCLSTCFLGLSSCCRFISKPVKSSFKDLLLNSSFFIAAASKIFYPKSSHFQTTNRITTMMHFGHQSVIMQRESCLLIHSFGYAIRSGAYLVIV